MLFSKHTKWLVSLVTLFVFGSNIFLALPQAAFADDKFPAGTSKEWNAKKETSLNDRFKELEDTLELINGAIDYCNEYNFRVWTEYFEKRLESLHKWGMQRKYSWWTPDYFEKNKYSPAGNSPKYYPEVLRIKKLQNQLKALKKAWENKQPCDPKKRKKLNEHAQKIIDAKKFTKTSEFSTPVTNFERKNAKKLKELTLKCNRLQFMLKISEYRTLIQKLEEALEAYKWLMPDETSQKNEDMVLYTYQQYKKILDEAKRKLEEYIKNFNKNCGEPKDKSHQLFKPKKASYNPSGQAKNISHNYWEDVSKTTIIDEGTGEPIDGSVVVIPRDPLYQPPVGKDLVATGLKDGTATPVPDDSAIPSEDTASGIPDGSKPWVNEKVSLKDWAAQVKDGMDAGAIEDGAEDGSSVDDGFNAMAQHLAKTQAVIQLVQDQIAESVSNFHAHNAQLAQRGVNVNARILEVNDRIKWEGLKESDLPDSAPDDLNGKLIGQFGYPTFISLVNEGFAVKNDPYKVTQNNVGEALVTENSIKDFGVDLNPDQLRNYKALADRDGDGKVTVDQIKEVIKNDPNQEIVQLVSYYSYVDQQRTSSPLYLLAFNFLNEVLMNSIASGEIPGLTAHPNFSPADQNYFTEKVPSADNAPSPNDLGDGGNQFKDIDLAGDGNDDQLIGNDNDDIFAEDPEEESDDIFSDPKRGPTVYEIGDNKTGAKAGGDDKTPKDGKPKTPATADGKPPVVKKGDNVIVKAPCHNKGEGTVAGKPVTVEKKKETFIFMIDFDPKTMFINNIDFGTMLLKQIEGKYKTGIDTLKKYSACSKRKVVQYKSVRIKRSDWNQYMKIMIEKKVEYKDRLYKRDYSKNSTKNYVYIKVPYLFKITIKCLEPIGEIKAECEKPKEDCDCDTCKATPLKGTTGGTKTKTDDKPSEGSKTGGDSGSPKDGGKSTDGGKTSGTKTAEKCDEYVKTQLFMYVSKEDAGRSFAGKVQKALAEKGFDSKTCSISKVKILGNDTADITPEDFKAMGPYVNVVKRYDHPSDPKRSWVRIKWGKAMIYTFKCKKKCPPKEDGNKTATGTGTTVTPEDENDDPETGKPLTPKTGGAKPKPPCNKKQKYTSFFEINPHTRAGQFQGLHKDPSAAGFTPSQCKITKVQTIAYDTVTTPKDQYEYLKSNHSIKTKDAERDGDLVTFKVSRLIKITQVCERKCPEKKETKVGMGFDPSLQDNEAQNISYPGGFVEPACDTHGQADLSQVDDTHFKKKGSWKQPYDDQWALKRIGFKSIKDWPSEPQMETIVAVIDTGVDFTHPDLAGALWVNDGEIIGNGLDDDQNGFIDDRWGWNFVDDNNDIRDNNGHGTLVAGIIGARAGNKHGIAGVNPWVKIMPVKATDFDNTGTSIGVTEAIMYAVDNGADVINISIGGHHMSQAERVAVEYALEHDVLVVVASGNDGVSTDNFSPAGIPELITVASTDLNDKRVNFSNWGKAIDLAAPGVDILSLRARYTDFLVYEKKDYTPQTAYVGDLAEYYRTAGSSFSAPFVTGVASLIRGMQPKLSTEQVTRMLQYSARDIEEAGKDQYTGYGLLDAKAALNADPEFYIEAKISGVKGSRTEDGNVVLQVSGLADADQFKIAWFEVKPTSNASDWTPLPVLEVNEPSSGTLAEIPFFIFDSAPEWLIKLVVQHENGRQWENHYKIRLR